MPLMYAGNPREAADQVSALEKAGLDTVWVAEAYGFDSPTLMGYLAAKTETIEIGSAILNIYSRTPGALLQTAAGLDNVSGGRAILGLGRERAAGHRGLPRRALLQAAGPHRRGHRHRPPRPQARAADQRRHHQAAPHQGGRRGHRARQAAEDPHPPRARHHPDLHRRPRPEERRADRRDRRRLDPASCSTPRRRTWSGATRSRPARPSAQPTWRPLEVNAGGMVAIGEGPETKALLDFARPIFALYVGGMGAQRQELLQRRRLRLRLREGGRGDPGPLPLRQEEGGRGAHPHRVARGGQPRRPRVVRPGADRGLPARPASPTSRSPRPATTRPRPSPR